MFFFLATDRSDKDSVVHCTLQVGHSGDPSGNIYCRSYTYCRRRQFMTVLAANIVVGDNMCQIVPHIFLTHIVKHF